MLQINEDIFNYFSGYFHIVQLNYLRMKNDIFSMMNGYNCILSTDGELLNSTELMDGGDHHLGCGTK